MKSMLDEECFKMLNPIEYRNIKKQLFASNDLMVSFRKNARIEIENVLKETNTQYTLDFRVKSIYSIYKKMKRK
jgi:GTP diphosphokinase / guanosine-3',5'-bis(diphosphate) 3'-diphosphatase